MLVILWLKGHFNGKYDTFNIIYHILYSRYGISKPHFADPLLSSQSIRDNNDLGSIEMLMPLWWRQSQNVGGRIIVLMTFLMHRIGHQQLKHVINLNRLEHPSPTSKYRGYHIRLYHLVVGWPILEYSIWFWNEPRL